MAFNFGEFPATARDSCLACVSQYMSNWYSIDCYSPSIVWLYVNSLDCLLAWCFLSVGRSIRPLFIHFILYYFWISLFGWSPSRTGTYDLPVSVMLVNESALLHFIHCWLLPPFCLCSYSVDLLSRYALHLRVDHQKGLKYFWCTKKGLIFLVYPSTLVDPQKGYTIFLATTSSTWGDPPKKGIHIFLGQA